MALEITVDLDAYAKGQELAINGLGRFENGSTIELTDEQEWAFVSAQGDSVRNVLSTMDGITVKGRGKYDADDIPDTTDVVEPVVEETEE